MTSPLLLTYHRAIDPRVLISDGHLRGKIETGSHDNSVIHHSWAYVHGTIVNVLTQTHYSN